MKALRLRRNLVLAAVALFVPLAAFAEDPSAKPAPPTLASILFPADIILHYAEELSLTAAQREFAKTAHEEARSQHTAEKGIHDEESARLAKMVRNDEVDEECALAQLDKVLASESKVKRVEFDLIIRLTLNLNADQRAMLPDLKAKYKPIPHEVMKRLQTKKEKVITEIELLQTSGIYTPDAIALIQSLSPVLRVGDFVKAESILDEAIAKLALDDQ